jgi:hypothetical protein
MGDKVVLVAVMNERRKAQRKRTDHFFGVYHRETDEFIGKLFDMSTKGMMLHAVLPMELNTVYEFRIDLPKFVAGKRHLSFDAECVRCTERDSPKKICEIGFKITDIEFEELETIQYLLNDALFQDAEEQPRVTLAEKLT